MKPRREIPLFKVAMSDDVDGSLSQVLHSGWIGQGQKVAEFEAALQVKLENSRVLCLSAGTHGLTLALRLAGVGPGDEVVTTPLTCAATNVPILQLGADVVWADVKDDCNIDPASIRRSISERTKAIMVVHWGGYACDMEEIAAIAHEAGGIPVIEDCAHAYGASYRAAPVGACTHADYAVFSFQAIKHLTCADGGALCCRRGGEHRRGKLLRWFGIDRDTPGRDLRCEDDIAEWGYKFHMNDVAATIGLANLALADRNIAMARDNARYYLEAVRGVAGVRMTQTEADRQSSRWLFTMMVEARDAFVEMMRTRGIAVSPVHQRNDAHSCFRRFARELPGLDRVAARMISIPVGWWLSEEDRTYIAEAIKRGW